MPPRSKQTWLQGDRVVVLFAGVEFDSPSRAGRALRPNTLSELQRIEESAIADNTSTASNAWCECIVGDQSSIAFPNNLVCLCNADRVVP